MSTVMPVRQIGALDVSLVGLGCNNFGGRLDERRSTEVVEAALDAGINLFDTADVYGSTKSEEILGRALGKERSEVLVATKFGMPLDETRKGAAPAYVKSALEDSLRRLGTDYVDLYQLHRPDPATPIGDTLSALAGLVEEGKVREIGCSNFSAAQLREAEEAVTGGGPRFASVQNEYSLLQREPELEVLAECDRLGTAFIPYFPLKAGLLSGKYRPGEPPPAGTRVAGMPADRQGAILTPANLETVGALQRFAGGRGHSVLELAIAWLAAHGPVASVIAGATQPEQVWANVKAADWVLTDEELAEIDAIVPPPGVPR
jgi:aryl-alcohol dehydrogenase-like predicted oxidoreductase